MNTVNAITSKIFATVRDMNDEKRLLVFALPVAASVALLHLFCPPERVFWFWQNFSFAATMLANFGLLAIFTAWVIHNGGKGLTWTDKTPHDNGGGCYNCHQLSHHEIAYGTIGPSLHNFAKLRGNSDDIVKYAYDKIYNSNAFNACTNMPRFGLHNWLTPEEITHVVAFLMDPESPVNKD